MEGGSDDDDVRSTVVEGGKEIKDEDEVGEGVGLARPKYFRTALKSTLPPLTHLLVSNTPSFHRFTTIHT